MDMHELHIVFLRTGTSPVGDVKYDSGMWRGAIAEIGEHGAPAASQDDRQLSWRRPRDL
jgi:hypothetical protein